MPISTKNPDDATTGRLMTAKEASDYTGIPLRQLQRLAADRKVPHMRIAGRGRLWFQRERLDRWIAEQQVQVVTASRQAAPVPAPRPVLDNSDRVPRKKRFA